MAPVSFSTMEYREELARVKRARRRNAVIVVVADVAIVVGAAFLVLTNLVF